MAAVLLVEDELALRAVLSEYLAFFGHEVTAVAGGEEALAAAGASRPDVIVSDVLMPGMDGIELCKRIKAQAGTADIPFLFMTARNVDDALRSALDSLGDGSVLKPFEPAALLEAIRAALFLAPQRRAASAGQSDTRSH